MALRGSSETLLLHPTRAAIVQAVQATPGLGFLELGRRVGVAPGTLRHHVKLLERGGLVRAEHVGRRLAIVPADERRSPAVVALLREPAMAALRDFVAGRGRVYQRQVMAAFPMPKSTVQNRLHRLAQVEALHMERCGRWVFYEVNHA